MNLGPIAIIDPPVIGDFPLRSDYGTGMDLQPSLAIHGFDQPGLKIEQRFVLGAPVRRFRVRKEYLSCTELDDLRAHWQLAQGSLAQFNYKYIYGPGAGFEMVLCRYENPNITFNQLVGMITGDPGITLSEVVTTPEVYTADEVLSRFPSSAFNAALTQQVQTIIPLVTIQDRKGNLPIYVSNRLVQVNGIAGNPTFIPRLLTWGGLSQTLGEASDGTTFQFGNADDAWTKLVNHKDGNGDFDYNLFRAYLQFSLLRVDPAGNTLVHLWAGNVTGWAIDLGNGTFTLPVSDGAYQLGLSYPTRMVTRTCWKVYKGRYCPSTSSLPDCPKSWEACNDRGVPHSFGGLVVLPQKVRVKDNSTGVIGFGRSVFTSVTVAQDTVYQRAIQEVYTDKSLVVTCDVAGGRDEGDFYSALGIVGEGPIGGYNIDLVRQRLDGQPPHDPKHYGGWRGIVGHDPAPTQDYFGLDQAPWNPLSPPPNSTYAAGLAFAEIRRTDEKGLQLSDVADRAMSVTVIAGIGGWTWTAPGARVWKDGLANPVWVLINVWLRANGLRVDPANASSVPVETMEALFDVNQAIAAADICDISVTKIVGTGFERQFPFRGSLKERKPLKDWLQEICNCCLGFYTFVNGKLWPGIRINSSVPAGNAFTRDTILFKSLQINPHTPAFNWLIGEFGDEEFDNQLNNVTVYDIDYASYQGSADSPQYTPNTINFVGVSNKSQCARIVTTRLREELGGTTLAEQLAARRIRFRTTILGLQTMVGDIISLDHTDLPNGRHEGRVRQWTLNPDYSIDIETTPTTDSMYDLDAGPKPDDVPAEPSRPEQLPAPNGLAWMPNGLAPFAGDPLYTDPLERTFALQQDYNITRDGTWNPAVYIGGEFPINQFVVPEQPRILEMKFGPPGSGSITGPVTVYAAITVRNTDAEPATPSNLSALYVDATLVNVSILITVAPAPGTWATYDVWAGLDRRRIAKQYTVAGDVPATVTFTGPVHDMTQGLPSQAARAIETRAKHVWHSGVAGVLVTGVPAANQIQANDFIGSTDNWVGRILSALADQSDGSVPLWNFQVTAFDSATGTLTVTPDAVRGAPEDSVEEGDVLIVRSTATAADADSYTDSMWDNFVSRNQFGSPGLRPGEEKDRIVRILRGAGAGQFRHITGNDATKISIAPSWDTIPDSSSVLIVEDPEWVYFSKSSELHAARDGVTLTIRMRVDNLRDVVVLVGAFLVDDQGRYTDEEFACFREIYVFGQPPTTREIGPEQLDPATSLPWQALAIDHNLRVDTSANDVSIQLPPLYVYQGRPLLVYNDAPSGAFNALVNAYPGETLSDGSTMATITPGQIGRFTAG